MHLLKALEQALRRGVASGYEPLDTSDSKSVSRNPFKRWWVRSYDINRQQEPTYNVPSVRNKLVQEYGSSIGETVMAKVRNRPLNAREIVKLHDKATRLQDQIKAKNRQHSKEWGNMSNPDSMAAKLFTRKHGFSSVMLPDYEKKRLSQHIEQSFYSRADHQISKAEAKSLIAGVFSNCSPGFAEATPETARVLEHETEGAPLYPDVFTQWQYRQPFAVNTRNVLHNFRSLSSQSARLQWESPFDELNIKSWTKQISATQTHIDKLELTVQHLSQNKELPEVVQQALLLDLYTQTKKAKTHIQYLQALQACDFRSADNMFMARMHNLTTARQVVDEMLAKTDLPEKKRARVEALRAELDQDITGLRQDSGEEILFMRKAINAHAKGLRDRLVKAGLPAKQVGKHWKKVALAASNSKEWLPIEKILPVRTDDGVALYKGTITPAAKIRLHAPGQPEGSRDPFTVSYQQMGRSSATRTEPEHAVNLAESRLTTDDGRVLYDGLRSGTLTPPTGTPRIDNIVESRAKELLQAAIVKKLQQLPADQQQSILSGKEPINFDMVSCSMLSPDKVRNFTGLLADEFTMQTLQSQALARLCSEPLSISLTDSLGDPHNVTANIRLTTVNVPVNEFGFNPLLAAGGKTWQTSDSENDKGFTALFGDIQPDAELGGIVGEWLTGAGADSAERDKVIELAKQIRTMYSRREHHTEGVNAYKLVERVQLLAFMIGAVAHMNCKSGKDRTGEADARTRQLASEVDRLGYVPAYNAPWTRSHREAVQTFVTGAGNLEVQMQNINVPAYKTATGKDELGNAVFQIVH